MKTAWRRPSLSELPGLDQPLGLAYIVVNITFANRGPESPNLKLANLKNRAFLAKIAKFNAHQISHYTVYIYSLEIL